MNRENRKKMKFAVMAVLVMMLLPWTAIQIDDGGGLDAADLGPDYTYTLTTDSNGAVTAVKKGDTAATPIKTSTTTSWGFDSDGYGPFNSFYAAFSTTDGTLVTVLNPNDLAHSIDSSDTTNYKGSTAYNIMWVLPKVYWKATSTSLILTNNPTGDGWCCLGHTIDGKEYNYLAIGVYEAYTDSSKMYSISDQSPTVSKTRAQFRTLAEAVPVDGGYAMQWNFFQWTLYKMCTYTVVGSKNVQKEYAYGLVNGSKTNTGTETNNAPYYSKGKQTAANSGTSGPSKVFIENSWGNVYEFVDNVIFSGRVIKAGYSHNATDTVSSLNVIKTSYSLPSSNWITATQYANEVWDLPKSSSSTSGATGNLGDYVGSDTGARVLYVGGYWGSTSSAGVANANAFNDTSFSNSGIGSRLAYVFDSGPLSGYTVKYDANGGTMAATEEKIEPGQTITLPTPTYAGHRFDGWYNGDTLVTSPYTPSGSVTLTAHWTEYAVMVNNGLLQNTYGVTLNAALTSLTKVATSGSAVALPDLGYQKIADQGQDYLYLHTGWSYTNANTPTLSKTETIPNDDAIGRTVYSTWAPVITISNPNNLGTIEMPAATTGTDQGMTYVKPDQTLWPVIGDASTGYRHVGYIVLGDNSYVTAGNEISLTKSVNAVSVWIEPAVIITYKSSADEHVIATISVPKGTACVLFAPNLEDVYAFGGWFTDRACTQRFNPLTTIDTDLTLWASAVDKLRFTSDPVSNGSITPYDVDLGTFLFDATLSESAYKVKWDFGDGTTSEERLIYHTYETPGKYTVTLTTTNYYGETDTRTYSVITAEEEQMNNATLIIGFAIILLAGIFIGRRFL